MNLRKVLSTMLLLLLILGIPAVIYLVASWTSIGTGTVMIRVSNIDGSISNPILGPSSGLFFNGFYRIVQQEYPIYIDYQRSEANTLGMWGDGTDKFADYPAVACFSKDQLEMTIDIYVRWELDTNKLVQLYKNYPTLNFKNVIASIAREQMRIITSTKYSAVMTIEFRDKVREDIMNAIISKLSSEPSLVGAIMNVEFELRNIGYPAEYTKSIEAKMSAEQKMMQAEYEKRMTIIQAEAEAQKILITAQAQANATVIKADSIATAIYNIALKTGADPKTIAQTYTFMTLIPQNAVVIVSPEGTPFIWQMPNP